MQDILYDSARPRNTRPLPSPRIHRVHVVYARGIVTHTVFVHRS